MSKAPCTLHGAIAITLIIPVPENLNKRDRTDQKT